MVHPMETVSSGASVAVLPHVRVARACVSVCVASFVVMPLVSGSAFDHKMDTLKSWLFLALFSKRMSLAPHKAAVLRLGWWAASHAVLVMACYNLPHAQACLWLGLSTAVPVLLRGLALTGVLSAALWMRTFVLFVSVVCTCIALAATVSTGALPQFSHLTRPCSADKPNGRMCADADAALAVLLAFGLGIWLGIDAFRLRDLPFSQMHTSKLAMLRRSLPTALYRAARASLIAATMIVGLSAIGGDIVVGLTGAPIHHVASMLRKSIGPRPSPGLPPHVMRGAPIVHTATGGVLAESLTVLPHLWLLAFLILGSSAIAITVLEAWLTEACDFDTTPGARSCMTLARLEPLHSALAGRGLVRALGLHRAVNLMHQRGEVASVLVVQPSLGYVVNQCLESIDRLSRTIDDAISHCDTIDVLGSEITNAAESIPLVTPAFSYLKEIKRAFGSRLTSGGQGVQDALEGHTGVGLEIELMSIELLAALLSAAGPREHVVDPATRRLHSLSLEDKATDAALPSIVSQSVSSLLSLSMSLQKSIALFETLSPETRAVLRDGQRCPESQWAPAGLTTLVLSTTSALYAIVGQHPQSATEAAPWPSSVSRAIVLSEFLPRLRSIREFAATTLPVGPSVTRSTQNQRGLFRSK